MPSIEKSPSVSTFFTNEKFIPGLFFPKVDTESEQMPLVLFIPK